MGEQKYANFLCKKLAAKFKKEENEFKPLVIENIQLDYSEIEKVFAQKFKAEEKAKKEEEKRAKSAEKKQKEELKK